MGKLVIGVLIVAVLFVIGEMIRENKVFRVTRYHVRSPKIDNSIRFIFISDLHNKSYGNHNQKLIAAIDTQRPDMILVGGDMLVGRSSVECFDEAAALLKTLSEKYLVYYANGNHEQRMKEDREVYGDMYERYMEQIEGCGIHFLANQTETILLNGQAIDISGLEIPFQCYTKGLRRAEFTKADMETCIGSRKGRRYHILLAHNPAYIDTYKEWGADLILSGHLHGGLVRIPGIGGMISPQLTLFPKYSGEFHHEENADIVVSKGLGSHTIPIRLFDVPELIVIQLKAK